MTAQYVTVTNPSAIPVLGADSDNGRVAIVQQQINVRSGPGTGFNSLGTLSPQDVVNLTGKDSNGTWLQIEYPSGPEGKGWVSAGFVQAQGVESLPIITEAGHVVGTGTPTTIPATPTRTLIPAPTDDDSAGNPIVSVIFDPSETYTLIYNGDVSSPAGDPEDWIRFVPFGRQVSLEVSCMSGELKIDLMQESQQPALIIGCDSRQVLNVTPGQAAVIHIRAAAGNGQMYSAYTVKVKSIP